MIEREYIYEVGLTPTERERLSKELGVHCLSLADYADVKAQVEALSDE